MSIAATEQILVPFEGEGGGLGELTWAQQTIWAEMRRAGKTLTMCGDRRLPADATVAEFVDELRFYLTRYQAMRTLLRFEVDGQILQVVKEAGVAAIEVYDAGDRGPDEVAAEVALHLGRSFDYEREWPIRMALVRREGVLTHSLVALAHHLADATSGMAMFEDMRDRDPVTGEPPRPPGTPPLEQARLEQTPAARRQSEAALRYWEGHLRVIPPTLFTPRPDGQGCWEVDFTSAALHRGTRAVAARLGVSTRPVLYAAYATALARITGVDPVATLITVNNRFRRGLANASGHMIQHGLCTLDTVGVDFDELVLKAWRRLLAAQKNAYYAQNELDELIERIGRERGVTFDLLCLFNDIRADDGPAAAAPAAGGEPAETPPTVMSWRPLPGLHQRLMLHVRQDPDTVGGLLQVDTAYFSRADVDALFEHMQTLVLEAADRTDAGPVPQPAAAPLAPRP
jgi:hypothetical protein